MKYVCGYMFDDRRKYIALILKERPVWQKGKWNGIGGKIEEGETPHEAMVREFREETGVEFYDWEKFAVTKGPTGDDPSEWEVHYFRAFDDNALNNCRWTTDEIVAVHKVSDLPSNLVTHNHWLIPAALHAVRPITVIE